ncbi:arylamine N-acetyltransferase [Streptomyces prunicolor]|uniref:arylamine N-acetyltransferase family protein n=1 Tax=Streptomyces prunicolor TaxID=67348 RepID=UPI00386CF5DB|nr:arylamine N-acetyltransferase [Streptomyces prunicolor]
MDEELIDAYLERIGAKRPERVDADTLRHLHERHVLSVPFENLFFLLGEPIPYSLDAVKKIVHERRGGGCFELNSAFAMLLEALGFQVTLLAGCIYRGEVLDSPIGHLALRVETDEPDGHAWLVDVGQGSHSRWPMRLDLRTPQFDPHGAYLLDETPEGDIDVFRDGSPLYRMEMRPRKIEFGLPSMWWYQTAPDSPFRNRLICVQPREDGKVTLANRVLVREQGGERTRERIVTEEGLKEALETWFGIHLDQVPKIPGRTAAPTAAVEGRA